MDMDMITSNHHYLLLIISRIINRQH